MIDQKVDDEASMLAELNSIEQQINSIGDDIHELSMRKKFLRHRAADIRYALSQRKQVCCSV